MQQTLALTSEACLTERQKGQLPLAHQALLHRVLHRHHAHCCPTGLPADLGCSHGACRVAPVLLMHLAQPLAHLINTDPGKVAKAKGMHLLVSM